MPPLLMGMLVDHLKPKKAGLIGQVIVIAALLIAWHAVHSNVHISERLRRLCGAMLRSRVAPPHRAHGTSRQYPKLTSN